MLPKHRDGKGPSVSAANAICDLFRAFFLISFVLALFNNNNHAFLYLEEVHKIIKLQNVHRCLRGSSGSSGSSRRTILLDVVRSMLNNVRCGAHYCSCQMQINSQLDDGLYIVHRHLACVRCVCVCGDFIWLPFFVWDFTPCGAGLCVPFAIHVYTSTPFCSICLPAPQPAALTTHTLHCSHISFFLFVLFSRHPFHINVCTVCDWCLCGGGGCGW